MSKRVLVNGDKVFLNIKGLPKLLEKLQEDEIYLFENGGLSYWFEKLAVENDKPVVTFPKSKNSDSKAQTLKKLAIENKLDEHWFVTSQPLEMDIFEPMVKAGCTVKFFSADSMKQIGVLVVD